MGWYENAVDRWYRSRPDWKTGRAEFFEMILLHASGGTCLEIGPGPENTTSRWLASVFSRVDGLDIDPEALKNRHLSAVYLYDGQTFPLSSASYDVAVADYVLEHVAQPQRFLGEVARVLKPGGRFLFRTPHLWHYVSLAARVTPHWAQSRLSAWLRRMPPGSHPSYPTYHRLNTRRTIARLARQAGLEVLELRLIEKEPSYGRASPLLFYPLLAYERLVNASDLLAMFRGNLLGALVQTAAVPSRLRCEEALGAAGASTPSCCRG